MPALTPQQKNLFEQLSKDRQQNAAVLEKLSMKGIKSSVIEKYSDQAHFIYELLQNADDVKATKARFILKQTGLIFAHNGTIHFSLSSPDTEADDSNNKQLGHINAITSIGNSNKYEAQIGKFGLGFKAVFQYTNTPEIYDPPFLFKIERFIVPVLLTTDHPDRQADETLFYLPFDNSPEIAFQAILKKLKNLTHPLLFLRHLTEISWIYSDGSQGKYSKTVKSIKVENTPHRVELVSLTPVCHFLVFTAKNNSHCFSNAIGYLMRRGQVLHEQTFPAYCFFPTKETTNLRFIVQAPFLLTDSREGIKYDEEWNKQLIVALAQLTADSLSIIKEIKLLSEDFFKVLPINEQDFPAEYLFRPIYEAILIQLQSYKALLPTKTGGYTTRDKAYLAENPELMNLLSSQQLTHLVKNDDAQWVFPQITSHHGLLWDYVKNNLINQEINYEQLVRRITKTFIQNQSDEWLMQFYTASLWKSKFDILKTKPILRLTNDKIVSAYNRAGKIQVYLPTEQESEYPTIKRCFVKHDKSLQFLQAFGLDKPQEYEEINYYILPRYQQKGKILPAVMRRDFQKIFAYFLNCPWHQKVEYLDKLKQIAFCRARYFADNSTARVLPQIIYFKTDKLANYFNHFPNIYFLDSEFYAEFYNNYGKTPLNNFFKELGIEDKPRRIKIKATLSALQRQAIHNGQCTHDYYHYFQYTYDYDIEGLDAFCAHINLANSKMLWQFLLKLIEDNLEQEIFKGQYNWFYRRERYYYFDAKFFTTLRQTAWLYNNKGNCVTASNIIVPELVANYETNNYAAKILIEKLEIQPQKLSNEQRQHLAFGNEVFKLVEASGKKPAEVLKKIKQFLANTARNNNSSALDSIEEPNEPNKPNETIYKKFETVNNKLVRLEEQLTQQIDKINKIEALQSHIENTEKYSFDWFNSLLKLECLLSDERIRINKKITIKFSQVKKDPLSDRIIILKNPSSYIPQSIEDIVDLSLQLRIGTETKNLLIEVVSVKEFTIRARLKSAAEIQEIDLDNIQNAVVEIKNPTFILEHLKVVFRRLPYAYDDNLQAKLTQRIEFIIGPPGTGKTTYLAKNKIIPLMRANLKVLVLTPTNKVADVLVRKIMPVAANKWLIRFGVTGDGEIESAGFLKDKFFDITPLTKCVVVTTVARFLYDGFSSCKLKDYDWDIIIFDEASMIMLAQMAYVLYQQANCHFIIGGDPFQIQPVVVADAWKEENIYTLVGLNSIQTVPHNFLMTNLTRQYRSVPPIGALFSQFSYDGKLTHQRKLLNRRIKIDGFELREITLIKFPVSQFDSIYRSLRLDGGSAYHIYSAIFTVELALYLSKQVAKHNQARWKLGIICPYLAQATLVEKMIAALLRTNSQIVTGTVHGFQGEEFDIILNLLNAPPQIGPNIFLNNQNILNVAISRAKDYLILIIPDIEGLDKIKRLETIIRGEEIRAYFQEFTSAEFEQIMFNQANYIYENSFITSRKRINVYEKSDKKYEVRFDEHAVDIQLNV